MEIMMSFAEAILFIVVPQAEAWGFQELLGLRYRLAGKNLHCTVVGLCKGVEINHLLEDRLDLHVGEVNLLSCRSAVCGCCGSGCRSCLLRSLLVGVQGLHGREQQNVADGCRIRQ